MARGRQHWDEVYGARSEDALTWFEATPTVSLDLVRKYLQPGEPFIDIGAGASRLVDALLDEGFARLTVLDLSAAALAVSRQRLGPRADEDGSIGTFAVCGVSRAAGCRPARGPRSSRR